MASPSVRSATARVTRAVVVVGTSLLVGYGLISNGALYRGVVLGPVGVLFSLIVAPWAILMFAILTLRSIHLSNVTGPLTMPDALLLAFVVRRAWVLLSERRFSVSRANGWLIAFVGWAWVCTVFAGASVTSLERLTLYAAVAVVLAADAVPYKRLILGFFLVYAVVEVVVSLPSEGGERLLGLHIGDPHQLSILCLAAMAPLLSRLFDFKGRRAVIVLLIVSVVLARARGPIVAMSVMLFLQSMGTMSRRRILGTALCLVLGGALLYGPATSAFDLNDRSKNLRQQSIARGIQAGLSSPLYGQGWSADLAPSTEQAPSPTPDFSGGQQPYNLFASAFAFMGFPGLILLLMFVSELMRSVADVDRTSTLFYAAFLTLSLTEMTFYAQSLGTVIFFVYCGLGQRAASSSADAEIGSRTHREPIRTSARTPAPARRGRPYQPRHPLSPARSAAGPTSP